MGWVVAILSWLYMWFVLMPATVPTIVEKEVCNIPENSYVVKTFEKNTCIDNTDKTIVWQTIESVKVEQIDK